MRTSVLVLLHQRDGAPVPAFESMRARPLPALEVLAMDNRGPAEPPPAPPGVRMLPRPERNLGFAAGCNRMVREARGEWVALLNPDAAPEAGWLEALEAEAGRDPLVAAVGSIQFLGDGSGRLDGAGDAVHASGLCRRIGHGRRADPAAAELLSRRAVGPCAAAALYRRDAFLEAGGFDEDFFCYCEDVDLALRLRLRGRRAPIAAGARVVHAGGASSGGPRSDFAVYHGQRNVIWAFVKNFPGWLFWALLPVHVAANAAAVAACTLRGQGGVALRAKVDAARGLPRMWRKRREVQAARTVSCLEFLRMLSWRWP